MSLNLETLSLEVASLAERAGDLIMEIYHEDFKIFEKKDGSPVTTADQESHEFLKKGLEKLMPEIPVISEEDEESWLLKSPLYWLVDPLDGTKGFIHKTGEFCINIALVQGHQPLFGLIHIPLTQQTFFGYKSKAYLLFDGDLTPLKTRPFPADGLTLLLGGHGKKFKEKEDFFLKSYPIKEIKRIQSAIKFCYVAAASADLYLRFNVCSEWDTAAGQALVEAAGGVMTNLDGTPFLYGKPGLLNGEFVVFGCEP